MKQAGVESRDALPHVILFTGHRVDKPDRPTPRFPESKVAAASAEIENAIDSVLKQHPKAIGVAGAASGGDILFHEALRRRGIPTEIYLALPPDLYARRSVDPSQGDWRDRFDQLVNDSKPRILQEQEELSVWERANLWMLGRAMAQGGSNMTLIALWNGQSGDGPGGTADMITRAKERGARVVLLGKTVF